MALTANREVDHFVDQELRSFQVAATVHVFKGGFVGLSAAGYAQPLVAGDPFVGIAYEEADNTSGADGALSVRVYTLGDFGVSLAGAAVASIGRPVFASSDDTLTFTGAANSYLGVVEDVITSGEIILRVDPGRRLIKTMTHAVEDLGAGVDIAARAIHGFATEGWIVSARVVNQATAAAGIDNSNTCVLTLATGSGTVVTETFDLTTTFPAANSAQDIGAVANAHVTDADVLTLSVTNGTTANPGAFLVQVDFV